MLPFVIGIIVSVSIVVIIAGTVMVIRISAIVIFSASSSSTAAPSPSPSALFVISGSDPLSCPVDWERAASARTKVLLSLQASASVSQPTTYAEETHEETARCSVQKNRAGSEKRHGDERLSYAKEGNRHYSPSRLAESGQDQQSRKRSAVFLAAKFDILAA